MNKRKILSIITTALLVAFYIAGAVVAGVVYNPAPVPPQFNVVKLSTEPDYKVTIAWKRITNAYAYELEYKYDFEPTKTGEVKTDKTSFKIERIKGNLNYRMRTVYNNGKKFSDYSDWKTFYVEPLYLPPAEPCPLMQYDAVRFMRKEWGDKAYRSFMFKGKSHYLAYYDFIAVGPGMDKDVELSLKHNMQSIPYIDIVTYDFIKPYENTLGDWTIYYRPALCMAVLQGERIYNDELLKIFDETEIWTSSHITVK